MPGKVVGFFQDLSHGPLGDDAQRVAYFQSLGSWDGSTGESSALWEQWRLLAMQLDQNAATTVTLWLGNNLCDEIFKAMACSQLVARPGNVSLVQVPAIGMRSFVAMHPPGQLAQLFETRKNVGDADRSAWAQEFARIRDLCEPVRRLEHGRVVGVGCELYDHALLESCGADWMPAGNVVGTAMGICDGANAMSDGFFGSRLAALVEAGFVEVKEPLTHLRDCLVRCARPEHQEAG
jgi:hypothetical protein